MSKAYLKLAMMTIIKEAKLAVIKSLPLHIFFNEIL